MCEVSIVAVPSAVPMPLLRGRTAPRESVGRSSSGRYGGRMLRLFDTAAGTVVPFQPHDPGRVSMYVCGPTVYAPPHLGHGRFSLVFDVLRRYLEWSGFEVNYVSNITDVDDNIVTRAREEGRSESEVVHEYEELWVAAMDAIGVKPPTHDPHATAYVERMVEFIGGLVEAEKAYETSDGVYFAVESVPDYGKLARQDLATLQAGARVQVDDDKRSPVDFALWKRVEDDGSLSWDSPWGRGRPGWHTECVVMSLDLLGEGSTSTAAARTWPFRTIRTNGPKPRPRAGRLPPTGCTTGSSRWAARRCPSRWATSRPWSTSSRTPIPAYGLLVSKRTTGRPSRSRRSPPNASGALAGLDRLAGRCADLPRAQPDPESIERLRDRMDDDLDTPAVAALLFGLARRINALLDESQPVDTSPLWAAVGEIITAVGLELHGEEAEVPPEMQALAGQRDQARAEKDWASADAIRDQLQADGWTVEDTAEGTVVRPV